MHVEDIKIPGDTTLAAKLYVPTLPGPRPAILLCHGFASCKEEFMALPHNLCREGWAVLTFDYSGHGESTGHRAYVSEKGHLEDTLRAYQTLIDRPEVDIDQTFIIGHSLGTSAVLRFLGTPAAKLVRGGILLAPMRQTRESLKPFEQTPYSILSQLSKPFQKIFGKHIYVPYRVKAKDIYESPEAIQRANTHKILQTHISVRNYPYVIEKQDNVLYAEKVKAPMLVMAAEKDKLIPVAHSKAVFDALPVSDKTWEVVTESGHSLLGDRKAKEVTHQIIDWLAAHMPESPVTAAG